MLIGANMNVRKKKITEKVETILINNGYTKNEVSEGTKIKLEIDQKIIEVKADLEVRVDNRPVIVFLFSKSDEKIDNKEILYINNIAKAYYDYYPIYTCVTNGIETFFTNIYSGKQTQTFPTKPKLISELSKERIRPFSEAALREIKSTIYTLHNPDLIYKSINKCKTVIEKKGLIRSDQSFKEMTKILLVKMNEERRAFSSSSFNRFSVHYFVNKNIESVVEEFEKLLNDAIIHYPGIYKSGEEKLKIEDSETIIEIIKLIESFSFIGTGEDIKGTMYEIFLKNTLRGDFDQYFTPKSIVNFIIKYCNPDERDTFVDVACGSGGFLIQAFNHVNQKIINSNDSELEKKRKFQELININIWGHEADYDLHVLAKINLIMHGDGWNHIYQGDTLNSNKLPDNYFDYVFTNPPFTIRYEFEKTLSRYTLGQNKNSEELDILFIEKSVKLLKPGGELYIVLPEGLLNLKKYQYLREWLLENTDLKCSISLPEGAFVPFGGSGSKTCILGVRKKGGSKYLPPQNIFIGDARQVGYEKGKKFYREHSKNDLAIFLNKSDEYFDGIETTPYGGECGWIKQSNIKKDRIDAKYLLNEISKSINYEVNNLVKLGEVVEVNNKNIRIKPDVYYNYLEIPNIDETTGMIKKLNVVLGKDLKAKSLYKFLPGDIIFTKINPKKKRVTLIPEIKPNGYENVVSKEVFNLTMKEQGIFSMEYKNCLIPLLKSDKVHKNLMNLVSGSSSSRARIQKNDFLESTYIPIIDLNVQKKLHDLTTESTQLSWSTIEKVNMTEKYTNELLIENNSLLNSDE